MSVCNVCHILENRTLSSLSFKPLASHAHKHILVILLSIFQASCIPCTQAYPCHPLVFFFFFFCFSVEWVCMSDLPACYICRMLVEIQATYGAPCSIMQDLKTTHVRSIWPVCQSDCILACLKRNSAFKVGFELLDAKSKLRLRSSSAVS